MSQSIPNRHLVVYVLSILGGGYKRIHTEDIAVKAHELFPESFSWTKYREYPDKDIVRVTLVDARKEKYGALVDGRSGQKLGLSAKSNREPISDGWILTKNGIDWIKENEALFENAGGSRDVKEHRQKVLQQLKRVKQHRLFDRFRDDPDRFTASIGEIADLLRCRVDAEPHIWSKRFESLKNKAHVAGQEDVSHFIGKCEHAYMEQR